MCNGFKVACCTGSYLRQGRGVLSIEPFEKFGYLLFFSLQFYGDTPGIIVYKTGEVQL